MKKKAQNLLEYALILALIAVAGAAFVMKFDLGKIKNYVFNRPTSSTDSTKVEIRAMTK